MKNCGHFPFLYLFSGYLHAALYIYYTSCCCLDGSSSYSSHSNQEAADVLSQILKNLPHKPMKSVGLEQYHNGHSFRQYPIPGDETPPPFKPLNDYPTFNVPFESPDSEYGPPNHYSHLGHSSEKRQVAVNPPKAYDTYHSMKKKMSNEKNFVTLPTLSNDKGLEIQKSIEYEIEAWESLSDFRTL